MDYTVVRSRRRTAALQVKPDGTVVVRVPLTLPNSEIEKLLASHADWLQAHIERQQKRAQERHEPTQEEIAALRQKAKEILPPLVHRWAERMGVAPTGVKITAARTRFGSCSGKDSLCFSLYLMQYPPETIEAVVVHELAHIRHKNHGAEFYREVERYLPDYRARVQLLRT